MKLATLKTQTRDGQLVVVSRDLSQCVPVPQIAAPMQAALDDWARSEPELREVSEQPNAAQVDGAQHLDAAIYTSAIQRDYQWAAGYASRTKSELNRRTRISHGPESFDTPPLIHKR